MRLTLVLMAGVLAEELCDSCASARNGVCEYFPRSYLTDDDGPASDDLVCDLGTDCADCSAWRGESFDLAFNTYGSLFPELLVPAHDGKCADTCHLAHNGVCDYVVVAATDDHHELLCTLGTDCSDCVPWAISFLGDGPEFDDLGSGDDLGFYAFWDSLWSASLRTVLHGQVSSTKGLLVAFWDTLSPTAWPADDASALLRHKLID